MRNVYFIDKKIKEWINLVLNLEIPDPYYDIHVGEISKKFKPRDAWVEAGLFCLKRACLIRNRMELNRTILLCIRL